MADSIEPPDSHRLLAAQGWAELGVFADAEAELNEISEPLQRHPDVLTCRYELYARFNRWDLAAGVAQALVEGFGQDVGAWVSLAYAVRRKSGGGIPQAREVLQKARELFPAETLIAYNLACYDCQLGDETAAMQWLKQAILLGGKKEVKDMALKDSDLKPLWQKILWM